jgi:hypothetical protein
MILKPSCKFPGAHKMRPLFFHSFVSVSRSRFPCHQFIMSADSTLEEWNNKINARLQSKPLFAQTLDSLLQELKNSLLLVLKPALASAPAPTEVAAPNNDTTESSAPEVDLTSPVARIKVRSEAFSGGLSFAYLCAMLGRD